MTNDDHKARNSTNSIPNLTPQSGEITPPGSTPNRKIWLRIGILGPLGLLFLAVWILPLVTLFSSWSDFLNPEPVSPEDRYYYINQVLEDIDYTSAGEVLHEEYDDNSPHPLNPARFEATIQGTEAFEILSSRIDEVKRDCKVFDLLIACDKDRPSVSLKAQDDGTVLLILSDMGVGRE